MGWSPGWIHPTSETQKRQEGKKTSAEICPWRLARSCTLFSSARARSRREDTRKDISAPAEIMSTDLPATTGIQKSGELWVGLRPGQDRVRKTVQLAYGVLVQSVLDPSRPAGFKDNWCVIQCMCTCCMSMSLHAQLLDLTSVFIRKVLIARAIRTSTGAMHGSKSDGR